MGTLVDALSRSQAERIKVIDKFTVGRRGFLTYLKALDGGIVKMVPSNGVASDKQHDGSLKVVCGRNVSHLPGGAWIGENTAHSLGQLQVSPSVAVNPNLGTIELATALTKIIPFTSTEESKPILNTVLFRRGDGVLNIVSADGYRLAIYTLPLQGDKAEVMVQATDLKALIPALRKAKRVRLDFEASTQKLAKCLVLETELVSYRLSGDTGSSPDYENLIPKEDSFKAHARFDTRQAGKAVQGLASLWFADSLKNGARPVVIAIADGKLTLESKEEQGKTELEAETEGEAKTAVQLGYLAQALKACGGMVELQVGSPKGPMIFSVNGYRIIQMPLEIPHKAAPAVAGAVGQALAEGQEASVGQEDSQVVANAESQTSTPEGEKTEGQGNPSGEDTTQPPKQSRSRKALVTA